MRRTILSLSKAKKNDVISSSSWRFMKDNSLNKNNNKEKCRVLFAGSNFQAGYSLVKEVLSERGMATNDCCCWELVHAKTSREVLELAPTVHVAIPFMERFNSDFFDVADKLLLVKQFGVGLEGVDIKAATSAGIVVSNIPADGTGNAQATSEHAIWLIMSLLRYSYYQDKQFQNLELGPLPVPRSLYKKRITVVGYGCVGKVLTQYLIMMGANVTVVRKQSWKREEKNDDDDDSSDKGLLFHRANSLEEALPNTEILVLACTMTPETLYLINDTTLSLLPQENKALVVNVGRGPLVKYSSILDALQSNRINGFASDVGVGGHPSNEKPSEPWDPNDELSLMDNTIFTPHIGGYTDYSYKSMANKVVDTIESITDGIPPDIWVNKL